MIYFDNGATTFPKPRSVANAVNFAITKVGANPGRGGHNLALEASDILYDCRCNAAKLFNIDQPENVIITNNCTTALNTVIKGILNNGDHAVISSYEHNAAVRPLEFLKSKGVEYSIAQVEPYNDEATIDNFRNSFKENTKLVICTHASNVFGIKLPINRIAALCKINGLLFCTDAAQTAGIIPISLKNSDIDFLCTAGHKGLYGPMGTGLLVINSKTIPESLVQGGTGSMSAQVNQPQVLPDKFESGTHNLPGIAGLNEGIKYVLRKTPQKIYDYEMSLAKRLYDGISTIEGIELYTKRPEKEEAVPVISFNLKDMESERTAQILNDKYNIAVRAGLHCAPLAHKSFGTLEKGTVRAVISSFTTQGEVNLFVNSIRQINYNKRM